jgi:homoserine O-acetyltransferase/O-succinyltransferase
MNTRMPSAGLVIALLVSGIAYAQSSPSAPPAPRAQVATAPAEGDFTLAEYTFKTGERLQHVRLHYYTFGTLKKDAAGHALNAVLILHGTGGAGTQFLTDNFAGVLFGAGQPLDTSRYFIVLPDNIGHGKSSKPSDGLHMKFPRYDYDDMVALQKRLLTDGLGIDHLRLLMGTSMGGMHSWVWAYTFPAFMDAVMPLASLPVEIAGRNRVWRRLLVEAIRHDPAWKTGEYTEPPYGGLTTASALRVMVGSAPLNWQALLPDPASADTFVQQQMTRRMATTDANDLVYQVEASRTYDPRPHLAAIQAPLMAVNFADDQINPPELGILEKEIVRVPHGRAVLLPATPETRGHSTHTWPVFWKQYLVELLGRK